MPEPPSWRRLPRSRHSPAPCHPLPPGWTTVFGDDFAGAAGSAPSSANWFYDIGTGFGTGEIEHTTNSTTTGTGGTQTLNVTGSGRYIRMYGTVRATQYGYSIYEFQVYGS